MSKLHLNLINPKQLIDKLNRDIIPADGYLEPGRATLQKDCPISFADNYEGKSIRVRRQYPLIQVTESGLPFAEFFGWEKQRKAGFLFFEEGSYESDGLFANVKLRIWRPLELEDEDIPNCHIDLSVVIPKYRTPDNLLEHTTRTDYVKRFHTFWRKTDLTKEVKTEWFLR
jgi:hypothetical protein